MIHIDGIIKIIENIPMIVSYIVYGYVYLTAYYWISFKDKTSFNNFVIKCVASNYILTTIYDMKFSTNVFLTEHIYLKTILYLLISLVLGLLCGGITSSKKFNDVLRFVRIQRTANDNIWTDVIQSNTFLKIYMNDNTSYTGLCHYVETYQREPIIVLSRYKYFDADGKIEYDCFNDKNYFVMINSKDFERIEIIYSEPNTKDTN